MYIIPILRGETNMCVRLPFKTLKPAGTIDINEASSIMLDKLEEMGVDAEIYLPDKNFKVYRKSDVIKSQSLHEISAIRFVAESHDCDDFAAKLYGKWAGLVWTNKHAMNWFISDEGKFYFVEPQNKNISETLDAWQGDDIRFLIGR